MLSYLEIVRPANLATAVADVLAGYAVAGGANPGTLAYLVFSGTALYAGGVVLNDYFDRTIDRVERPERPIPSGRVPATAAAAMGGFLLTVAIGAGFCASVESGLLAVAIAGCVLFYDGWAKHVPAIGPIAMGLCRGLNLLLGLSANAAVFSQRWFIALLPIVYIAAVTAVSSGEVKGGSRRTSLVTVVLFGAVCGGCVLLGLNPSFQLLWAAPLILLLGYRVLPALWRAFETPAAANIRAAVKAGVLSIVILDSAIAAGYAGPWYGAAVLSMLGIGAILARTFAVT
jgi:4-hydroxybenzoate polyprenyltransferase